MKGGNRKSYNDWTRKVMARQTREHRHKKRIVRTLIFPTVLYSCETWTMTKKMEKKINACEMWIWRKMQRISWMEKKTNESVRMEIGIEEDETLQQTTLRRKARILWTCYAIRWIGKRNDAGTRRGGEDDQEEN